MSRRAGSASPTAVDGRIPAPQPAYRSPWLLSALALTGAAAAVVAVLAFVFGVGPATLPPGMPLPWWWLFLAPSAAALLLAFRGKAAWSLVLGVIGLGLPVTGAAALLAVIVALIVVRRVNSQWAAHDLDTVLTTAAASGLPVLVVEHVAGGGAKASADKPTTHMQVRDVSTGALATARVWGRVTTGTHLVRDGMNVIAAAPPGAERHLRRWAPRFAGATSDAAAASGPSA